MEQKVGYRMITYRFRLYCGREELLSIGARGEDSEATKFHASPIYDKG